jgi:hypothetical protein
MDIHHWTAMANCNSCVENDYWIFHGLFSSVGASPQTFSDRLDAGRIYVASSKDSILWPIVADHSYAVLDVLQVNGSWFVDLYNPWARDARALSGNGTVAVTAANDGKLRISWDDYLRNFDGQIRNDN